MDGGEPDEPLVPGLDGEAVEGLGLVVQRRGQIQQPCRGARRGESYEEVAFQL